MPSKRKTREALKEENPLCLSDMPAKNPSLKLQKMATTIVMKF